MGAYVLPSRPDGTVITGSIWSNDITVPVNALLNYTAYTPTWVGGSPTIGNGTLAGNWLAAGMVGRIQLYLKGGSTTTWGSASDWTFSLPNAAAALAGAINGAVFSVMAKQSSGGLVKVGTAWLASTTTIKIQFHGDTAAGGASNPFTWATNDELRISGEYVLA